MDWGVQPDMVMGHSISELVSGCFAGVFSLENALRMVALRGQLMQVLPAGAMVAVPLAMPDVERYLTFGLSIAAHNGPAACVVSGLIDSYVPHRPAAADALDDLQIRQQFLSHVRRDSSMRPHAAELSEIGRLPSIFDVFVRHYRALHHYFPKPAAVRVGFLAGSENSLLEHRWTAPWADLALGGCEIVRIPGDHFSLLDGTNADRVAGYFARHDVEHL